jgi:hypothetical protein
VIIVPDTQNPIRLDLQIRFDSQDSCDRAFTEFKGSSPPDGVELVVTDLTSRGAFDVDWIVGLGLGFPIGIAGNLVAAWLLKRLQPEKSASVIIVFVDQSINLAHPGAEESLTAATERAIERATASHVGGTPPDG